MASKKNVWRGPKGGLQFRRETKRYSDGTPWGHDVLFVRVRRKACVVFEPFHSDHMPEATMSALLGTYRLGGPVAMAKLGLRHIKAAL